MTINNKKIFLCCLFLLINLIVCDIHAENSESEINITSAISGIVKTIHVKINQTIKQGELLLEFDETLINSNLLEANAMIKLTQINLLEAKKELERSKELFERTVLSEHDLQVSKVNYFKALSLHSEAENKLKHSLWDKKHHKLYAPYTATINKILTYTGQYINNKYAVQPIFVIQRK